MSYANRLDTAKTYYNTNPMYSNIKDKLRKCIDQWNTAVAIVNIIPDLDDNESNQTLVSDLVNKAHSICANCYGAFRELKKANCKIANTCNDYSSLPDTYRYDSRKRAATYLQNNNNIIMNDNRFLQLYQSYKALPTV